MQTSNFKLQTSAVKFMWGNVVISPHLDGDVLKAVLQQGRSAHARVLGHVCSDTAQASTHDSFSSVRETKGMDFKM